MEPVRVFIEGEVTAGMTSRIAGKVGLFPESFLTGKITETHRGGNKVLS
jgi:hypothetical protein